MEKEDILRMSQKENEGKPDERELAAHGNASRIGMIVGSIVCVCLVLISRRILHSPEVALSGWMLYFTMMGTRNVVLARALSDRYKMAAGIVEIIFAVGFASALAVRVMAA